MEILAVSWISMMRMDINQYTQPATRYNLMRVSVRLLVETKAKLDGPDGAGYTPLDTYKLLPAEPVVKNNIESLKANTYWLPLCTPPAWHI